MRGWKRHPLGILIKQTTGLGIQAFVRQKLNDHYPSFAYRLKKNVLRLHEYHAICLYTGLSFEELFPNPLRPIARKIPINLGEGQTIPRKYVPVPLDRNPNFVPPSTAPREEPQEKGPDITPGLGSNGFIDPFEGGLPPLD